MRRPIVARETLVLLPGVFTDAELWDDQIRSLQGHSSILLPIALNVADTMAALAEQVLWTAPPCFNLAGVSLGGHVAMEILRRAPRASPASGPVEFPRAPRTAREAGPAPAVGRAGAPGRVRCGRGSDHPLAHRRRHRLALERAAQGDGPPVWGEGVPGDQPGDAHAGRQPSGAGGDQVPDPGDRRPRGPGRSARGSRGGGRGDRGSQAPGSRSLRSSGSAGATGGQCTRSAPLLAVRAGRGTRAER